MEQISEPKNPNELCWGECKIAGVFTVAQKQQSGGLVPYRWVKSGAQNGAQTVPNERP
jgi:hypothetical protein